MSACSFALEYTINDDGVHLLCLAPSHDLDVNLGFNPSPGDVLKAANEHGRDSYVIVTRYVRPKDGRVIRHVYAGESGEGWPTRARAQTQRKRHVAESMTEHGATFVAGEMQSGRYEVNVVKVINL